MKDTERDWSLDFLRILACLMVVGIHTSILGWYDNSPRSYTWTVLNFYDTLCRPAVPLFVMISGSLFLRRKETDFRKLWLKNILNLFVMYYVWVVFYAVMNTGIKKSLENPALVWETVSGSNPQFHLWYLRTIIYLYALSPLLSVLVRALDKKKIRYFFILFLAFELLRSTVYELPFIPEWLHDQINLFGEMHLMQYTGYFLLGYFLSQPEWIHRISSKVLLAVYTGTMILAAGLNQWISIAQNWPAQALYGNFSLPVTIESVCLFLFFRQKFEKTVLSPNAAKWLVRVSSATLFVYLSHMFVIQRLQMYLHLYTTNYNVLFSVPLMALLVFILCEILGIVLERIPVINRIL